MVARQAPVTIQTQSVPKMLSFREARVRVDSGLPLDYAPRQCRERSPKR